MAVVFHPTNNLELTNTVEDVELEGGLLTHACQVSRFEDHFPCKPPRFVPTHPCPVDPKY